MNRAIILRGRAGSGKTTTLRKVYTKLRAKYPEMQVHAVDCDERDLCVIVQIKYAKIGILTIGDPNSHMGELLEYLVKELCDIIVCASRTRGSTIRLINILPVKYIRSWRGQSVLSLPELYDSSNEAIAELMLDEILSILVDLSNISILNRSST